LNHHQGSSEFLPRAGNSLGLVFFPAFDWAISPDHPEREERLLYTMDQLMEEGLASIPGISMFNPVMAGDRDVERAHFCVPDASSLMNIPHRISAGGAMEVARRVLQGEIDRGFAMVRPPGHHAMKMVHGCRGFCLINNEAVMIEYMRSIRPGLRVAVVDTDCHHGDGTQDIYYCDPDTLFISIHQDGRTIFPGTGSHQELGLGAGLGYTVNVPLPPRSGDESILHVMEHLVMPLLDKFKPDIIINSAGQDNHWSDPITAMNFSAQGYARLTHMLGAHIAVLEGGYAVQGALPYVNTGIILAMAGLDYSAVREPGLDSASLSEAPGSLDCAKQLCDFHLQLWERGDLLREGAMNGDGEQKTSRRIFYDTDGFLVQESLEWKGCGSCPGYSVISSSRQGNSGRIIGITPHSRACPECQERAIELYERPGDQFCRQIMLGPCGGEPQRSRML